jgi:hypothetical protein
MASRRTEDLHPFLTAQYRKAASEFEKAHPTAAQPFITSTYRSSKEQDDL